MKLWRLAGPKSAEWTSRLETEESPCSSSTQRLFAVEPGRADVAGEVRRQSAREFFLAWVGQSFCSVLAD